MASRGRLGRVAMLGAWHRPGWGVTGDREGSEFKVTHYRKTTCPAGLPWNAYIAALSIPKRKRYSSYTKLSRLRIRRQISLFAEIVSAACSTLSLQLCRHVGRPGTQLCLWRAWRLDTSKEPWVSSLPSRLRSAKPKQLHAYYSNDGTANSSNTKLNSIKLLVFEHVSYPGPCGLMPTGPVGRV